MGFAISKLSVFIFLWVVRCRVCAMRWREPIVRNAVRVWGSEVVSKNCIALTRRRDVRNLGTMRNSMWIGSLVLLVACSSTKEELVPLGTIDSGAPTTVTPALTVALLPNGATRRITDQGVEYMSAPFSASLSLTGEPGAVLEVSLRTEAGQTETVWGLRHSCKAEGCNPNGFFVRKPIPADPGAYTFNVVFAAGSLKKVVPVVFDVP
jgi:hypothetical protein